MKEYDGYIRVSRVAGRGGESFISPDEQRKAIEAWALARGVTVARWHVELDESGANRDRPKLAEALERAARGDVAGIVAAKLDRIARNAAHLGELMSRAKAEGWALVAIDLGLDASTPNGKLVSQFFGALAEWELDQRRESWKTATSNAIDRGVFIGARPPFGYSRGDDGRLVPNEDAPTVLEIFGRRANGEGVSALADWLEARGVPTPDGGRWHRSTVEAIVKRPTYLGHVSQGGHVNESAHEPIVTRAEYDAANAARRSHKPRTGELSALGLLISVGRCAACDGTLKHRRAPKSGLRGYYCDNKACDLRGGAMADTLEPYVDSFVLSALAAKGGPVAKAVEAGAAVESAERAFDEAEHVYRAVLSNTRMIATHGEGAWERAADAAKRDLDLARGELTEARQASGLVRGVVAPARLVTAWPTLSVQERRQVLVAMLDRVTVRGNSRTAGADIGTRVEIVWRGNVAVNAKPDPRVSSLEDRAPSAAGAV